jgi:hypothetical protein
MKSKLLIILGLLLTLSSCIDEEVNNYDGLTSNLLLVVNETFLNRGISEPILTFSAETEEHYPCINYQIVSQTTLNNGHLSIDILGTDIGDICFTAFGPATLTFELDESVERITISNNGKEDEYLISIDGSSVTINPSHSNFSSFEYSTYYRFPENSFAYLCGTLVEDSNVCGEFEHFLKSNLTLEEFEFPTNSKIPYPASSDGYWSNSPAKYFKYQNPSDLEKAGELLGNYFTSELSDKEGIGLSIIGWNNTYYRNDQQFN